MRDQLLVYQLHLNCSCLVVKKNMKGGRETALAFVSCTELLGFSFVSPTHPLLLRYSHPHARTTLTHAFLFCPVMALLQELGESLEKKEGGRQGCVEVKHNAAHSFTFLLLCAVS